MFTLNDQGLIVFREPYKQLYGLFYHSTHQPYIVEPPSRTIISTLNKSLTLEGDGFLLVNGSPFVRLAVDYMRVRLSVTASSNTTLRLYRMSVTTGMMVPLLDTCFDVISVDLKANETKLITLNVIGSICMYVTDKCTLTVESSAKTVSKKKLVGKVCLFTEKQCKSDSEVIYVTLDTPDGELLDVTLPKFAVIELLVHQSLDQLSLPPPLLSFGTDFSALVTHSCNMVYIDGKLWSDFKGGSATWSLDLTSTQTVLKSVKVTTIYSSPSPLAGVLTIRSKYAPDQYIVCDASQNRVRVSDIASITLSNIRLLKSYDCISVVVSVMLDGGSNIFSCKCEVEI